LNASKVIKVRDLEKVFPPSLHAVKKISFDVNKNEIFGLLGSNGSGKSTTLRMIATVLQPTRGQIEFAGADSDHKKIRNIIGYIPQQDLLYSDLSVYDNAKLFSYSYDFAGKDREKIIGETLERLELTDYKNRQVGNLSGGYKKRLSIAVALLHKPKIIIADEITIGLDPDLRKKIWQLLLELKKEASIIFTTHYLEEAQELCDRIALMNLGEIISYGEPSKIIKDTDSKNLDEVFFKLVTKGSAR
jgi:ABC-2 type transport system ATP-binding protein